LQSLTHRYKKKKQKQKLTDFLQQLTLCEGLTNELTIHYLHLPQIAQITSLPKSTTPLFLGWMETFTTTRERERERERERDRDGK